MTEQDGFRRSGDEGGQARERLQAAQLEERHVSDRYDAASGGSEEVKVSAELREAGEQVAAREAWVEWLERDY